MAGTQRSNIEVFFTATGVPRVKKAFKDLESSALSFSTKGLGTGFSAITKGALSASLSLVRNLGGLAPAFRLAYQASAGLLNGIKSVTVAAISAGTAVGGIGLAFKSVYDSTAELTSVVLALRAVNNEVGKTNSMPSFVWDQQNGGLRDNIQGPFGREAYVYDGWIRYRDVGRDFSEAAQDLSFLNRVSRAHGVSIKELGKDYATLKASAIGSAVAAEDIKLVTEGIADAALVLGRAPAEVHRANIALGQMASKGQVYAEELKGQLSEALPGAIPIAAKAYGVTVKKFNKMVADGSVNAATFFKKFSRQLKEEYGESAKKAADTTRVAAGQLANAWFNAKVAIGNGALDNQFKRILKAATKLLDTLNANGSFTRFGKNLAAVMDPLIKRFEKAVDGAYDFNRVLDRIVGTFRFLIRGVTFAVDMFGKLSASLRNLRTVIRGYGIEIPSLGKILRSLGDTFVDFTQVLVIREFGGNAYANFFAAIYIAIEQVIQALARLVFPKSFGDFTLTISERLEKATDWLNQFAAAVKSLSTGKADEVLNDQGIGILATLGLAVAKIREIKAGVVEASALLSGKGVPDGADFATQQRFALRDKVGDLVTGRPSTSKTDAQGNELVSKETLDTLFRFRDLLKDIIDYLDTNKDAFKRFFAGVVAAINGALFVADKLQAALDFVGVNKSVAYLAGMYYLINKIIPLGKILQFLFVGISAMLGISTVQLGTFLVAAALIVFAVGKIVSNWRLLSDEIGNVMTLLGSGFKIILADVIRALGDLLSKIPGLRGFKSDFYDIASALDNSAVKSAQAAAAASKAATAQRAKENGGVDPYEKAGPTGFDAFEGSSFANGFKDFLKRDLLPIMGSINPLAGMNAAVTQSLVDSNAKIDPALSQTTPLPNITDMNPGNISEVLKLNLESMKDNQDMFDRITRQNADQLMSVRSIDQQLQKLGDQSSDGSDQRFRKPVIIYLSDGSQVELRGREGDAASFESLAAKTARNRPSAAPGWAG